MIRVTMEGNTYIRLLSIPEPVTLDMDSEDFARIRGYAYVDLDMNDVYSGADDGVESKITFARDGTHINETTSGSGFYSMRLYHESYTVSVKADGYEDFKESYDFTDDEQVNYKMIPFPLVLKGTVWYDKNRNGINDPTEVVPFVPITIKVSGENVNFSTMSDAHGNYSITLNPGSYQIKAQYSYNGRNFSLYSSSRDVTMIEGIEEQIHNLEIILKYEITGKVRDYLKKTAVENAVVDFLDEHGNTISDTESDENGEYRVVIAEGEYTLHSYSSEDNRTLVYLETVNITKPQELDIDLLNGVKLQGALYSGEVGNGVDIGRIDLQAYDDITLNTNSGENGEFTFYLPTGKYHIQGDNIDRDLVPDVEYILDTDIEVIGIYNYRDFNVEVRKDLLYGFDWSIDSDAKVSYIGYTADGYRGPEFVFSITNTGNDSENIALTYVFDNKTYWENANFEPDTIDIEPGETEEVVFRLHAQETAPHGRVATITINASVLDEEEITDSMVITATAVRTKTADAVIESVELLPFGDIYEDNEFSIYAELTNGIEFSKSINVTAYFEHRTPSGQWEILGKNVTTLTYNVQRVVEQTFKEDKGNHLYRIRLVPKKESEDKHDYNNKESIEVKVLEKPEEELTGWKGILDIGTNNERISWLLLIVIFAVIGASFGYIASSKKRRRSRRYKRRHSR